MTNALADSRHLWNRLAASNKVMLAVTYLAALTKTDDARLNEPGYPFQRTIPVTLADGTVALAEIKVRYRHPTVRG